VPEQKRYGSADEDKCQQPNVRGRRT